LGETAYQTGEEYWVRQGVGWGRNCVLDRLGYWVPQGVGWGRNCVLDRLGYWVPQGVGWGRNCVLDRLGYWQFTVLPIGHYNDRAVLLRVNGGSYVV
jgi:hypothetical protein